MEKRWKTDERHFSFHRRAELRRAAPPHAGELPAAMTRVWKQKGSLSASAGLRLVRQSLKNKFSLESSKAFELAPIMNRDFMSIACSNANHRSVRRDRFWVCEFVNVRAASPVRRRRDFPSFAAPICMTHQITSVAPRRAAPWSFQPLA